MQPRGVGPPDPRADPQFVWLVGSRAVGLAILAYLAWRVWARGYTAEDYLAGKWPGGFVLGILSGADLVFHEAGHWIFAVLGEFIAILGGSLNQVLIPAICTGAFLRQRKYASAAVPLFWTGESMTAVALYASDARDRLLPLLGGDTAGHDWGNILTRLGLLHRAGVVGGVIFAMGMTLVLAAVALMVAEVVRVWQNPGPVLESVHGPGRD